MGSIAEIKWQLDSDLNLSEVADTADGAVAFLARSGDALRFLNRANVFWRVFLGRQLQMIQKQHLWDQMKRPSGNEQSPAGVPYHSWDDFMAHGFPQITGLSPRIGYAALTLANSPALLKLPEPQLKKFENLGNAFEIVKLERKGVHITGELILAAQTLPVEAFRQMAGSGKPATLEVAVDRDKAPVLQAINDILKRADSDALRALQEVLRFAMVQGGENPTDALDCICAVCQQQWSQEGLPELAAERG